MDPRQPQQLPFARPPERSLIHNPNHQSPQTSQPPLSNYPPSPQSQSQSQSQSPAHVPYPADPYGPPRRDPFLPSASQTHSRKGSYGMRTAGGAGGESGPQERHGGWGNTAGAHGLHHASHHHPQSGPPPPPPPSMSGAHNPPGHPPYTSRRQSLGGASPPNPYGAPSHDPPPPPPSFARPHMPPPSSPQQQHHHAPQAQRAPFSSSFGATRELPGLGAAPRPGSSMAISSLIAGSDTATSNHASQSQASPPSAPTNAPPSNSHSMQPPSPRRGLPSASRPEFPPFRRQPSPDRLMYGSSTSRAPEGLGYAATSPPHSYSSHGSPEHGRQAPPHTAQPPFKPMIFQSARPYAPSPNDQHGRDPHSRQSSGGGIPPRPNSQPSGPSDQEGRSTYDHTGARRTMYGQPEERRRTLGESHHTRPNTAEILGKGPPSSSSDRDGPVTVQPVTHSAFSPPREQRGASGSNQTPRGLWRPPPSEDTPRETTEVRREEVHGLYRGYGGYPAPAQGPAPYGGHTAEDMVRGRSLDHLNHRAVEQYHAPPTSDPQSNDRLKSEQLSRSLSSGGNGYPGRPLYDQHTKALLALGPEANRRTGRASPLPQAVQGAQAQPVSIGKDPSIKSEFGRMFSGLGSGLGSSTPSRQSPMPGNGPEPPPPGLDLNDLRLQRVSSQNGRKPKRVKDEEGIYDNESLDGRGTPSGRGTKRNKHNHQGHHHHYHNHPHPHHHHHLKPDGEVAGEPHAPSASSTPFTGRQSNPPPIGAASQASHHHHHHHAAPHHHHHAPRASQTVTLPSPRVAPKIHDIQGVLDEAAKQPRYHLGSYLYEATPETPKPNSQLDDQFGYASKPRPLPLFERNPVNCTVTCRIHRYYLRPRQRQQIVLQRHLWGARVYRDDSDPIAAAIHSGWIRGEWDDTVDVNMLDPRITAPNEPKDAEDTLSERPAAPVTPPADMELQIDLLILPGIENYGGTVEYGISSRRSRAHDGLSFVVQRIRWVEEGVGSRGQERTAAAMKRRLDAAQDLLALTGGKDLRHSVNAMAKLRA